MGNNTGVIYGQVQNMGASATVDLNWVQQDGSAATLQVGGDSDLTTYTPRAAAASSGKYVLPFFWQSYQSPGAIASALAMNWAKDGTYTPLNMHGNVAIVIDIKKIFNGAAPDGMSTDPGDATRLFWTFWQLAAPELKAIDMVVRFLSSGGIFSTEQVAIACWIDF